MGTSLAEKQEARLAVLHAFYKLTDGDRFVFVLPEEVVDATGLSPEIVDAATQYLIAEGLIRRETLEGKASITHAGVREVEQARRNPSGPTPHFAPVVIQQVFQAPVGAVQTGSSSTAHLTQNIGPNSKEIADLVAKLRAQIPAGRSDLTDAVDELESAAKETTPQLSRLRTALNYLRVAATDVATIGQFVLAIAQAYGLALPKP